MVADNDTVSKVLAMANSSEPTEEDFRARAIPDFARLEIPVRDRYALAEIAEHLAELARRLTGLRHDSRFTSLQACSLALQEIKMTNHRVKQARLKNRIPTRTGE
jgi:hypothetical protein